MAFSVPGYRVDQLLGYGSHAEVWSGRASDTGEPVALKRIILPAHGDPDRAAALVRSARAEAALLTALQHPSLIQLRQYVQTPAAAVLVMELAAGGSLAQLLRRRDRLSPAEVAAALSPIAAALAYAHSEGVLHGDISAANVLFSATGQPKLGDLGVARMLIGHAGADRSLGTPAYLDPVVAAGGAAGAASDVFSLAAVALQCVTGAGPWHSADPTDLRAVLARAATGVIDDLPDKLAGCPAAMAAVLSRALDPEPHRRGSAAEFALDLGASVPSAPVVLAAGRIQPGADRIPPAAGRCSGERDDPPGLDAVPADLTHVARLQVRAAPVEPPRGRRRSRRPAGRTAPLMPAAGLVAVLSIVLLSLAALAVTVVRHRGPTLAAGSRTGGPSVAAGSRTGGPTLAAGSRTVPAPAPSSHLTSRSAAVTSRPAVPTGPARRPDAPSAADRRSTGVAAGENADAADPAAVLRTLADRRAEAFAHNRPDLLATVYQSPALLAQDARQLSARVPAGCGLTGLRTTYQDVTVIRTGPQRLDLQVTASQPPASLVCAGAVRGHTEPAGSTRLALRLVRVAGEFRIASQRPG